MLFGTRVLPLRRPIPRICEFSDQLPQPDTTHLIPRPAQCYLEDLAGLFATAQQEERRAQLGPELHAARLAACGCAEMKNRFLQRSRLAQPEGQLPSLFPTPG